VKPYIITTWVAEGFMVLAAGLGLLWSGLYRDSPWVICQLRGQDLVTLFLVVPGLAIAMPKARIGNLRGRILWLGLMAYAVYTYAMNSFEVKQNAFFIPYIALLCLATLSVAGGAVNARPRGFKLVLKGHFPRRSTAWFLMLTGGLMASLWLTDIVWNMALNRVPPTVIKFETPSVGAYVLDLAFLIPAYISGGVLLALDHAVGYLMAGILLVQALASSLAFLAGDTILEINGFGGEPLKALFFAVFAALALAFLGFYMRALHTPAWHRFDLPIAREEDY
jgi:hypothetical protein